MLGYVISDKKEINVGEHEIKSFDILHKTDLNIFVVKNNRVLYMNDIINYACRHGNVQILEWFKNSGYKFKYNEPEIYWASLFGHNNILKWFKNRNVKKVIKWSKSLKFKKTIKYKTKNNYIKGYNKN